MRLKNWELLKRKSFCGKKIIIIKNKKIRGLMHGNRRCTGNPVDQEQS